MGSANVRGYNAAEDLLGRNAGRPEKIAYIDDAGACTYGELTRRVHRFASALQRLGVQPEQRILIAMLDTIDWPVAFLGAIKAGVVPVAANTLLTTSDYAYMLEDSRARALFVSKPLLPQFAPLLPAVEHVVAEVGAFVDSGTDSPAPVPTTPDDPCFWLYSSGSTGAPKGTVHVHSSL